MGSQPESPSDLSRHRAELLDEARELRRKLERWTVISPSTRQVILDRIEACERDAAAIERGEEKNRG